MSRLYAKYSYSVLNFIFLPRLTYAWHEKRQTLNICLYQLGKCWLVYQNLVTSGILLVILYFEMLYYMIDENMGFSVRKGNSTSSPGSGPNSCVTLPGLLYYHMPHVFIGKEVIVPVLISYGSSMINAIIQIKHISISRFMAH